ncbi:hypothetical protein, partial [Marinilabilia sp.]|uniref:hypothetical protein n=1 Tax=Marinilabilia sp. TaxID=2021252 RepID=UPI0025B857B8
GAISGRIFTGTFRFNFLCTLNPHPNFLMPLVMELIFRALRGGGCFLFVSGIIFEFAWSALIDFPKRCIKAVDTPTPKGPQKATRLLSCLCIQMA